MEKSSPLLLLCALLWGCEGRHSQTENHLSLLPQNPLVHLGDSVQFNCSMNCPSGIFRWKGLDTKPGSIHPTFQYSILSIANVAVHNEGSIICVGTCQGRSLQRTSKLWVYSLPDALQLAQHPEEKGSGRPAHLTCTIRRVYPPDALHLSWYQGEHRLETPTQKDVSSPDDIKDDVKSYELRLDLPGAMATERAAYRCQAELSLEQATVWRNKTLTFSAPARPTASTASICSEERPTTDAVTLKGNPTTGTVAAKVYPTTETATIKGNPPTETVTTAVYPRTETSTIRVNPTTETATAKGNSPIEIATKTVCPTTETTTVRVNLPTDTVTKGNLPTETVAAKVYPTTEIAITTGDTTTAKDATEVTPPIEITAARDRAITETPASRISDSIARKRDRTIEPAVGPGHPTMVTISSKANPTRRSPPKPGVDADSAAIWTVFSALALLTLGIGLCQLWKRLRFLGAKTGSFDLDHL